MPDAVASSEERDALAAELALGVLEGEDLSVALRLMLSDPLFSEAVTRWEFLLAPLHDGFASVSPPDRVWHAIEARLGAGGQTQQPRETQRPPHPAIRQLRYWRGAALLAGGIAASLALFLAFQQPAATGPARVGIAQMQGAADGPIVLARFDPVTNELSLRSSGMTTGALAP